MICGAKFLAWQLHVVLCMLLFPCLAPSWPYLTCTSVCIQPIVSFLYNDWPMFLDSRYTLSSHTFFYLLHLHSTCFLVVAFLTHQSILFLSTQPSVSMLLKPKILSICQCLAQSLHRTRTQAFLQALFHNMPTCMPHGLAHTGTLEWDSAMARCVVRKWTAFCLLCIRYLCVLLHVCTHILFVFCVRKLKHAQLHT